MTLGTLGLARKKPLTVTVRSVYSIQHIGINSDLIDQFETSLQIVEEDRFKVPIQT